MLPQELITAWVEIPANNGQDARRIVLGRPRETWQADTLVEVKTAIEKVEFAQRAGCWVAGFISYEAAPAFDSAMKTPPRGSLPLCWFASFEADQAAAHGGGANDGGSDSIAHQVPGFQIHIRETEYSGNVRCALKRIAQGDIYQVNYTVRARVDNLGDPLRFFLDRLDAVPMPHAAFLDTGSHTIVSLSPELFLRRGGGMLESQPMKGTAARRPSWQEDEKMRLALRESEKDRSENTMIVDLVRNDLGRVCNSGSVDVPELCAVSRYRTVHQMTSTVRGTLRNDASLWDIFRATFPPGSVTGAPKIRAMEIITELEPEPRGIYCGTIGVFLPGGDFECNVAIRTLEIPRAQSACLGLGSGIVAESDPGAEWQETQLKGKFLRAPGYPAFQLLETLAWTRSEGFRNLERHLRRLENSAAYFDWHPFPKPEDFMTRLTTISGQLAVDSRLRVLLSKNGELQIESAPLEAWPNREIRLYLYRDECVEPEDVLLYHKTTMRGLYERAQGAAESAGADEAVLLNGRGEVTETTRANLLVKIDGEWWTPPLSSGLLPGIWREIQLENGRCREAVITSENLLDAEDIVVGNSARGERQGRLL